MNIITKIFNLKEYGFAIREICKIDLDGDYFRLYTYADELEIPVFHVLDINTKTDICVCLFEPRYYQYTQDKYIYDHFLLDEFDKALRQKNIHHPNFTNWELLVHEWGIDHELDDKYKNLTQPDYTKLENNKIMKRSLIRAIVSKWNA